MDEKSELDKIDEVMLPGFRFHPTDEELVGFYLKRKIQQRTLPIELIKQLDIYKYDPWDLPKELATTGEKEWYFYCPRDRKYRNSARPNRVTGAGFWKATGTDRPIYSSEGSKCIGLKKSLVFYRGRAAKGIKTDWMMHEFRLPSYTDSNMPKKANDKSIPVTFFPYGRAVLPVHHPVVCKQSLPSILNGDLSAGFMFAPIDNQTGPVKSTVDAASLLANLSPSLLGDISKVSESFDFAGVQTHFNGFSFALPHELPGSTNYVEEKTCSRKNPGISHINNHGGAVRSVAFPFNLPLEMPDAWKPTLPWDSPPCPSEMSTSHSTNKCYT
ncbi:hypothetical protein Sjap_015689 [Stephania japonica]|uniref:NAC domain-containing protein n=1 Tax=Stephania japonica TaxID=461633 RepID=A0AAP0IJW7_9MAGN